MMLLFTFILLEIGFAHRFLAHAKLTIFAPVKVNFTRYNELQEIPTQHGAVAERWDDIDTTNIQELLNNPRYPELPTRVLAASAFSEPRDWGDTFGSRVYAWFEPSMTGYYSFAVASDGQTSVSISKTGDPKDKILICGIKGGVFAGTLDYGMRPEQTSVPIYLKKNRFYYLEALHKEMYEKDLMDVAVTLPDGSSLAPIPSSFLWTALPTFEQHNATAAKYIMRLAASWGKKWGAKFGALKAKQSGQKAGALAGSEAGAEAGATAGATAAAATAQRVATKYLSQVLSLVSGKIPQGNVFNIYTNCSRRDTVVSKREDILREAFCNVQKEKLIKDNDNRASERSKITTLSTPEGDSTEAERELALWKKVLRWVKAEEKNNVKESENNEKSENSELLHETTSWRSAELRAKEELQNALSDFEQKIKPKNLNIQESLTASPLVQELEQNKIKKTISNLKQKLWEEELSDDLRPVSSTPTVQKRPNPRSWTEVRTMDNQQDSSAISNNVKAPNKGNTGKIARTSAGTYTEVPSEYFSYSVVPGPGTDPDALARTLVTYSGAALKLVDGAKYHVHSRDVPSHIQYFAKNLCWHVTESTLTQTIDCQFFKVHTPGLKPYRRKEAVTVSFESVCEPGYFLVQKNYRFILQRREMAKNKTTFDLDTSFFAYQAVSRHEAFSFGLSQRSGWYLAETKNHTRYQADVGAETYSSKPDFLYRSFFALKPISVNDDPLANCVGVLKIPKSPSYSKGTAKKPSGARLPCPEKCCNCKQPESTSSVTNLVVSGPKMPSFQAQKEKCLAIIFVNEVGNPIKIISSVDPKVYLVNNKQLKIKIRRSSSKLQQREVHFRAVDLVGHQNLYINHASTFIDVFQDYCPEYKKILVSTTKMDVV